MKTLLVILILASGIWATIASMLILRFLEKHSIPVNFLFLRLLIFRYLGQYRKLTIEETGRVGNLFYHYVIAMNIALALILILIVHSLV